MRIFEPIVSMLNRRKYVQRFHLIALLIGIPLFILSLFLFSSINDDIKTVEMQKKGAAYNHLLKDLLRDVQICRGLTVGQVSSGIPFDEEIKSTYGKVTDDFQALINYDLVVGKELQTTEKLHSLRESWHHTRFEDMEKDVSKLVAYHNNMVSDITKLMMDVSNNSKLLLSNNNYSHYMVHDVIKTLPALTENLGQIRLEGSKVLAENRISAEQKRNFFINLSSIEQSLNTINLGRKVIFTEQPSLKDKLGPVSDKVTEGTTEFSYFIEDTFLKEAVNYNLPTQEFFQMATEVIEQSFTLYDFESHELERLMDQQLKELKWKRTGTILLGVVIVFFSIYCFTAFYLSIKQTVEQTRADGYLFGLRYIFSPQLEEINESKKMVETKYEETKRKLKEVEQNLSVQVINAHEEERRRVSRELHDGIGQTLYSILVLLKIAEKAPTEKERDENIQHLKQITSGAIKEVKQIARSLRPSALDDLGFIPALRSFVEEYKNTTGIAIDFKYSGEKDRLKPEVETALYRICQESLTNVAKYAKATTIQLSIYKHPKEVILEVTDNGHGFNTEKYLHDKDRKGIGLFSMKERAEALGGTFSITSKIDRGTTIRIVIPKE